jgi:hypothetical protein
MGFPLKVFSIKRNLVFMNNLYRKVAGASVGLALGFILGANKEAKAATFILTDPEFFFVLGYDGGSGSRSFDSRSDINPNSVSSVNKLYAGPHRRAFYEFDIGNLSLAPNTVIRSAILKTPLRDVRHVGNGDLILVLSGYVGNGRADLSDFDPYNRGSISWGKVIDANSSPRIPPDSIDFDVTRFVNERVNSRDDFAGFSFRIADRVLNSGATLRDNNNAPPSLIIETADATEPVPEPTTIFGSALALSLGAWVKRKKPSQQNKTTP